MNSIDENEVVDLMDEKDPNLNSLPHPNPIPKKRKKTSKISCLKIFYKSHND